MMRLVVSLFSACLVTLGLFVLMQYLIRGGDQVVEKPPIIGSLSFIRLQASAEQAAPSTGQPTLPPRPAKRQALPSLPELSQSTPSFQRPPIQDPQLPPELEPMVLGKPYLGSLANVIPAVQTPAKPRHKQQRDTPNKPLHATRPQAATRTLTDVKSTGPEAPVNAPSTPLQPVQAGGISSLARASPGQATEPGGVEDEAVPVFRLEPKYPRKAAKRRIEGWVKLEFTITEEGGVTDAVVVDSRPRRTFDRSALQSIQQWRFKPRVVDGQAVRRKASQLIEFKLASG